MIVISNISEVYSDTGQQTYAIALNTTQLATFTHKAEHGMSECLRKAAEALAGVDIDEQARLVHAKNYKDVRKAYYQLLQDKD